jgi:hypothetical protein
VPKTQVAVERERNRPAKRHTDCSSSAFDRLMCHQRFSQIPEHMIPITKQKTVAPCEAYSTTPPFPLSTRSRASWQASDQNCLVELLIASGDAMAMIGLKRTVYVHLGYLVNGSMVRYEFAPWALVRGEGGGARAQRALGQTKACWV